MPAKAEYPETPLYLAVDGRVGLPRAKREPRQLDRNDVGIV
jgi:hypothetical protein